MARSPRPASINNKPPPPRAVAFFDSHPSDLVLIKSHLRPAVAVSGGLNLAGGGGSAFIHEADLYAADPAALTRAFPPAVAQDGERAWYFLTPVRRKSERGRRRVRTVATGDGCWHGEARPKPVVDGLAGRRRVGHRQNFSFVKKEPGGARAIRTGWLMVELSLDTGGDDGGGQEEEVGKRLVLCKVYRSPRHPEPSDGEPVAAASVACGRKKKADDGEGSSAAAVAAPGGRHSEAVDDEMISTAAAAGREEKAADDDVDSAQASAADGEEDSAETLEEDGEEDSAEASSADGEDSGEASAAAGPARKRKADDGGDSAAERRHCPRCGFHLEYAAAVAAAESKPETTRIAHQVEGDSLVKDHTLYQFFV